LLGLTSIEVWVFRIDFSLPDGLDCGNAAGTACDSDAVSEKGSYTMDLMTGASTPALGKILVPEGLYKKVDLELEGDETGSGVPGNGGGIPDTAAALADSSGLLNLEGDGFCGGDGLRIRRNIEAWRDR
jgi:hypothetical protein